MDFFRWSMKSMLISYLLDKGFDKVLYIDCDMFFFNDYHFLFSDLDTSSVVINPALGKYRSAERQGQFFYTIHQWVLCRRFCRRE